MKTASGFSVLVFAPVMIAFMLPAIFLMPASVLLASLAIFDPTVSLSSVAAYNLWVLGPMVATFGLFLTGRWLFTLCLRKRSSRVAWVVIWAVFSIALFMAIWFGVFVLTSVGASDKPLHDFLKWTALFSAGLTLVVQVFAIPWLYTFYRIIRYS